MTLPDPASGRSGRIVFDEGHVLLAPAEVPPPGCLAARFSVISPGTERRRLKATTTGPTHPAGYMTIAGPGKGDEPALIAPVPHGAWVEPDDLRALPIQPSAAVETVAVARFQLMAALGLRLLPPSISWADQPTAVVGSGPVAVGCVLQLLRLGATDIQLVTNRANPPVAEMPGVTATRPDASRLSTGSGSRWPVVLDCVGHPERTWALVAPGGHLGLLGTPDDISTIPAVDLHRNGITAIGLHELATASTATRCRAFSEVLEWITMNIDPEMLRAWCLRVPGEQAIWLYQRLFDADRPSEPFLILEWS